MCETTTNNPEKTSKNFDTIKIAIVQEIKENIDINLPTKEDEDEEDYILGLA